MCKAATCLFVGGARWLVEVGHGPGFVQHVQGKKIEAVKIDFDGAPRMGGHQVAEILGQLCGRELFILKIKAVPHAPNCTGISVNSMGLQPLGLEVLRVGAVRTGKWFRVNNGTIATGMRRHGRTPDKLKITCPTIEALALHSPCLLLWRSLTHLIDMCKII